MTGEPSGPHLYRPAPPLSEYVSYFGYWRHHGDARHQSTALPRGAVTIVIDLSGRRQVDFAAVGGPALRVPAAFLTGAGTTSYLTQIDPGQTVITVHFRPAGAGAFLGMPLGELQDRCVGIDDIWGSRSNTLRDRLVAAPSAAHRFALLERFLLGRMHIRQHQHQPGMAALLAHLDAHPSVRIAEVCTLTGRSPKALAALFRSEVGQGPKTYLRVRRLQAALRRLDTGASHGAALAADLGYFDQAHFVSEFRSFTAITPTQYLQRRSALPSHVELAR